MWYLNWALVVDLTPEAGFGPFVNNMGIWRSQVIQSPSWRSLHSHTTLAKILIFKICEFLRASIFEGPETRRRESPGDQISKSSFVWFTTWDLFLSKIGTQPVSHFAPELFLRQISFRDKAFYAPSFLAETCFAKYTSSRGPSNFRHKIVIMSHKEANLL